jgi:hypothetical protein
MADGFQRAIETVDQQLVMAASRRTAAIAARDQADAALIEALSLVEVCEQELGMRARHVDLCDRQIDGLLDERGCKRTEVTA